ncbi:MAG: tRNA pseudouridine(38-40) synthase TruA [Oscillospiraceae bacterium]|nr:tRNA pseudouridine(38-40) synthase TruA [Oscillospiraceae bacterium]
MPRYKLTLCYEGTRYRGWQKQGNTENTIQGKLEAALSRLLETPIELAGCGRTDAGVHARRQVCSFDAPAALDCEALLAKLRAVLPEDIGALALEEAPPRFHARLSCTEKTYVYRLWLSEAPNVFERRFLVPHPMPLDLEAMRRGAALLCGRHDFSAFCSLKRMKKSAMRELRHIEITRDGDELRLSFTGDGFLYNMVRILTGTLIEVGEGKRAPEELRAILAARDRVLAGPTAPARGLTLWDVKYD